MGVQDFKSAVAPPQPLFAAVFPADLFTPANAPFIRFEKRDPTNADSPSQDDKTTSVIVLYMPPEIQVNYGAQWEDIQMTLYQYKDIGGEVADAVINAIDGFKADNAENVGAAISALKSLTGGALSAIDYAAGTSFRPQGDQIMKRTPNPHMAMMFKGVDFRTFRFTFQMMARNAGESDAIRDIIKSFKAGMHPSVAPRNSRFWVYPDSFNITLMVPNVANMPGEAAPYLFQIKNAVLENMEVNYAGSGIPSFFGETGAPVDIRMTLQFKELDILTREQIIEGY